MYARHMPYLKTKNFMIFLERKFELPLANLGRHTYGQYWPPLTIKKCFLNVRVG